MTASLPADKSFTAVIEEMRAHALNNLRTGSTESYLDTHEDIKAFALNRPELTEQEDGRVEQIKQQFGDRSNVFSSDTQEGVNTSVKELEAKGDSGTPDFQAQMEERRKKALEASEKNINQAFDAALKLGKENPNLQPSIVSATDLIMDVATKVLNTIKDFISNVVGEVINIIKQYIGRVVAFAQQAVKAVSNFISLLF